MLPYPHASKFGALRLRVSGSWFRVHRVGLGSRLKHSSSGGPVEVSRDCGFRFLQVRRPGPQRERGAEELVEGVAQVQVQQLRKAQALQAGVEVVAEG